MRWPNVYYRSISKLRNDYLREKYDHGISMYPRQNEDCAGMILFNQHVTPKWIAVRCSLQFEAVAICEKQDVVKTTDAPPLLSTAEPRPGISTISTIITPVYVTPEVPVAPEDDEKFHSFCPNKWSWQADKCWRLMLQNPQNDANLCVAVGGSISIVHDTDIPLLSWMISIWHINKMAQPETLIWLGKSYNSSECVGMQWTDESFQEKRMPCGTLNKAQYVLCEANAINSSLITCPNDTFACNDSCILAHKRCDRKVDCSGGEDEADCSTVPCRPGMVPCDGGKTCIRTHLVCDGNDICGEDKNCPIFKTTCSKTQFKCKHKKCIDAKFRCNFLRDCHGGDDEESCESKDYCKHIGSSFVDGGLIYRVPSNLKCVTNQSEDVKCSDFGEEFSPCASEVGAHQCFPRHRRCFLDVDVNGEALFCPGREHLEGCEDFDCPNAFKCPGSFCVPYSLVCDGKKHCPGEEDEFDCEGNDTRCQGKIRCPHSNACIPVTDWCNGVIDCKYADDEKLCTPCPPGCVCEVYATLCQDTTVAPSGPHFEGKMSLMLKHMFLKQHHVEGILQRNTEIVQLDLSENLLSSAVVDGTYSYTLTELNLAYNDIKQIDSNDFQRVPYILYLNLEGNPLQSINDLAFWGLRVMTHLNLSHLKIENIADEAFCCMSQLHTLNLSFNEIRILKSESFNGLTGLDILDISNNPLILIDKDSFKPTETLQTLYTPAFKYCCAASHVGECFPKPSEFSSCSDLMANTVLKIAIWILAFSTFIGNIGVIIWRQKQENTSILNFLVQHLGVADMTMGVYLLIIAVSDSYYHGHYYLFDEQWRNSAFCKIAGFLSMLSSEMSVFVLLIIVTDRITVVGLARPGLGEKFAYAYVVFGWVVCALLSILPIAGLAYFGSGEYIKNGACFLFNITEGKVAGWEYATAIFIVFNLFALVVLVFGYTFTFFSVSMRTGYESNIEGQVARKLTLVVFTDCCCWIPPITIGIMSLMDITVNPQIAVWVAVFAFPLNSTLNPILYTFSSVKCKEDEDVDQYYDYASHVQNMDMDGHSISDADDFAGPSTSTAAACTDSSSNPQKSRKLTTSKRRRTSRKRKTTKSRKGSTKLPSFTPDTTRKEPLDDIPEDCDASEEDETNVHISVSVAIKSKGHRRTSSSVGRASPDNTPAVIEEDEQADEKYEYLTTATFTTTRTEEKSVAFELKNTPKE